MPVRSDLKDMSITPQSRSMCSIGLDGFPLNIPGAAVHTFQRGGVLPAVSGLGCSNLQQGYNQFRFPLFLVTIRSCFNLLILAHFFASLALQKYW